MAVDLEECEVVARFLYTYMVKEIGTKCPLERFPRVPSIDDILFRFKNIFARALKNRCDHTIWDPERPWKDSSKRCISINNHENTLLIESLHKAGMPKYAYGMFIGFPKQMTIWINPGMICWKSKLKSEYAKPHTYSHRTDVHPVQATTHKRGEYCWGVSTHKRHTNGGHRPILYLLPPKLVALHNDPCVSCRLESSGNAARKKERKRVKSQKFYQFKKANIFHFPWRQSP